MKTIEIIILEEIIDILQRKKPKRRQRRPLFPFWPNIKYPGLIIVRKDLEKDLDALKKLEKAKKALD